MLQCFVRINTLELLKHLASRVKRTVQVTQTNRHCTSLFVLWHPNDSNIKGIDSRRPELRSAGLVGSFDKITYFPSFLPI